MEETVTISRKSYDELINIECGRDHTVLDLKEELISKDEYISKLKDRKLVWRLAEAKMSIYRSLEIMSDDEVYQKIFREIQEEKDVTEKRYFDNYEKIMDRNLWQRIVNKPLKSINKDA